MKTDPEQRCSEEECVRENNHTGFHWGEKDLPASEQEMPWKKWVRILAHSTNPRDFELLVAKLEVLLQHQKAQESERVVSLIEGMNFQMNVDEYLPLVEAWDEKKGYDQPFDDGYAQAKKDLIAVLKES